MPRACSVTKARTGGRRRVRSRTRRAGRHRPRSRRVRRRGVEARGRGNRLALRQTEPSGCQCRDLGHRLLRRDHQHNRLHKDDGCEFLGLCLPNLLCSATPQGQQRETGRVLLRGRNGGYIKNEPLQCNQGSPDQVLRNNQERARLGFGCHHTHPGLRRVRDNAGQGHSERRRARRQRGDERCTGRGVPGGSRVETLCEIALDSIRKGDRYLTWPSLYRPLELIACIAPEVLNWVCYKLYNTRNGGRSLGQRIVEATAARRLYPAALRRPLIIKTEVRDGEDATSNV